MNIKIVNSEGVEEVSQPVEIKDPERSIAQDGVLMTQQVAELFDLKPSEINQFKGKLESLIEYAKLKTDDHSPDGIKWAIRQLGVKVGTPPLGENLINYLNIYARLYLEGKHIEEQKQQFLKGEKDE